MEAAAGGGAEIRRLHIIYFLCRNGRIEHPHLIRVHHLSTNGGVRLRDAKRWLAELRGKDMPESFAWSYKRKYKSGHVWQDLQDEDLITPISDNEFVLKGSQISSSNYSTKDTIIKSDEKTISMQEPKGENQGRKASSDEIEEEESPESTVTDDSVKFEEDKSSDTIDRHQERSENSKIVDWNSSLYLNVFSINKSDKITQSATMDKTTPFPSSGGKSSSTTFNKSKSHGSHHHGASQILRSLISCRSVDTDDSVVDRRERPLMSKGGSDEGWSFSGEICRADKLGGSQRIYGKYSSWNQPQKNGASGGRKSCDGLPDSTSFCSPRPSSVAFKPVKGPTCSQCGKQFKPEKLHKHMKSCKGIKAVGKGSNPANADEKPSQTATESTHRQSVSAYLLKH